MFYQQRHPKRPLSALAGVLIVTGFKLASPVLFKTMWSEGFTQFIPFMVTLVSIVFTDLLIGIIIGLVVSVILTKVVNKPKDDDEDEHDDSEEEEVSSES